MRIPTAIREYWSDATSATVALITAFFLLFVVSLGYFTYQAHMDAERRARDRAFAAAQVVELNARSFVDLAEQAIKRIDAALGRRIAGRVTRSELRDLDQAIDGLPAYVKAYVVNSDGEMLFSTDETEDVKDIKITDREYFQAAINGKPFHISALMISRINGEQIFTISSRLEREGKFAGVAIIAFDARQLVNIANSLEFDANSTVSLIRVDGQLVARYPFPRGPISLVETEIFANPDRASGTYQAISQADGVQRIVGFRRVPGTELIAAAAINSATSMASFWRTTWLTLAFALPAGVGLLVASLWISRLLSRGKQRQAELERTLEVNRLLFRDTHHRVKNNLQSVQSLVRMQAIPAEAKMDLQRRIAAMTAVHEHIYRADQYVEVNAREFIPAIIDPLLRSFDSAVTVEYDLDPVTIDREHTTALALLLNEVVTNAIKYAFEGKNDGRIAISLLSVGTDRAKLRIRDNGVGFDPENVSRGMGTRLIAGMMNQLGGDFEYRHDNGTIFAAEFSIKGIQTDAPRSEKPRQETKVADAAE